MRTREPRWFRYLRKLFSAVEEMFDTTESIEMTEQGDDRLLIQSSGRQLVADKSRRAITSSGRVVARFDAIQSIDVKRTENENGPTVWTISLYLSLFSRIHIGRTTDDAEASIVAARLSTITGKKVLAWR
jgi:hypothetical protein